GARAAVAAGRPHQPGRSRPRRAARAGRSDRCGGLVPERAARGHGCGVAGRTGAEPPGHPGPGDGRGAMGGRRGRVAAAVRARRADVEALVRPIGQLQGAAVPASALERLVLPIRLPGFVPAMLDELCTSGEVVWAGAGALGSDDGWVVLCLAERAELLLPDPV